MNYNKYLNNIKFWHHLSDDEKQKIEDNVTVKKYSKGEVIDYDYDHHLGIVILISGKLRINIESEAGREITLFKMSQEDICVLTIDSKLEQVKFYTKMQIEEDSKVLFISAKCIEELMEKNIHVKLIIYEILSQKFSDVMNLFAGMIFDKFRKRLATYLFHKHNEIGKIIKLTKKEIAKDLNSAREVVARNLKILENENIIKTELGLITILNLEKLKEFAEVD